MIINNKFDIDSCVYLITDEDQKTRIVTSFKVKKNEILYSLACGTEETWHYDFEISLDKNFLL